MPTKVDVADTPLYVLLEGSRRIGPPVAGSKCESFIYGFSDNGVYSTFCANSELSLKPYPLVRGYLRNQVDAECTRFVVIDAAGPQQASLRAATVKAVLAAQESRSPQVDAPYCLTFDKEANTYRKPPEDQV